MAFSGFELMVDLDVPVFVIYPDVIFSGMELQVEDAGVLVPDTLSKTEVLQLDQINNGNFVHGYKIQPLPQVDTEIQAVTTWTPATRKTYAELVSQAAASPGVGLKGHIEIVYDGAPSLHNIARIEINVEADRKKTIYTFNIA
jgi:hypothetical protein